MSDPRYPIGPFEYRAPATAEARARSIDEIAVLPADLRAAVDGWTDDRLDTAYREGGWTVRQVVHHVPDSHLNAYVRTKLLLTEDHPTIRPYLEAEWARLPDSAGPIAVSLELLARVHERWVGLLRALPDTAFQRTMFHPESRLACTLDWIVAQYAWHGRHHLAHIKSLQARSGW
jgi:hypothetical protein